MLYRLILISGMMFFACNGANKQAGQGTVAEAASESVIPEKVVDANSVIQITWKDLTDVTFEDVYFEEAKEWIPSPQFGEKVKKLDQQIVLIKGYMVPLGPERYALSANPFASCFFCGNAGPESVMDLELTSYDKVYFTDDYVTFQGKLILNDSDLNKMCYVLEEAEEI